MERFVVVDLETTGHSPKYGNEIIEIGLVVIENRQITDQYSTYVKPNQKIPPFIKNLTGIDDEDVEHAPSFNKIAQEIIPYFEDSFFVAHHVNFDYEFLNKALNREGFGPIYCPTIDTVELSRIFFPKANGYKLTDLTSYLNIEHSAPHRALSDAYVTAQLFIKILEKIEQLPYHTLKQLEPLMYDLQSDFSIIYPFIIEELQYKYDKNDLVMQNGFFVKKISEHPKFNKDSFRFNNFNSFLQSFYEVNNLELRQEQIHMAELIHDAFEQKERVVIEAGTGIGKTLAYLLPSIYHSIKYNQKIIISTHTIQLQNQLINEEQKKLENWLNQPIDIVLLKSPNHYINLERLKQFIDNFKDQFHYDLILSLAIILVWLTETETGDFDELQLPSNGEDIWPYISGYSQHAMNEERNSYFDLIVNRIKNSNIILVNHSFLLANLFKKNGRLPNYNYLIVDEAHRFEEVARNQLAVDLDYISFSHFLNHLNKIMPNISTVHVKNMSDLFFREIYQAVLFLHSEKDQLTETGKYQITLQQEDLKMLLTGQILNYLNDFLLAIKQLLQELNLVDDETKNILLTQFKNELIEYQSNLETFFNDKKDFIRTIEIDQYGAKNAVNIHFEPITVNEYISENLIKNSESLIFTSGTIITNDSFNTFYEQIGLDEETKNVMIPSTYDYENQVRLYVTKDLPDVSKVSISQYASHVASFIYKVYKELKSKIFVLLTSYELLKLVHDQLKLLDESNELIILSQGITSSNREKLTKMYSSYDQAILLGTNSFWEGFDFKDSGNKTIILTRLPFDSPENPIFKTKSEIMKRHKQNVFQHYALPQAILRFRQAFGRLIRNDYDRGTMFILDKRIMTKSYGTKFIDSIPKVSIKYDTTDNIFNDAKSWIDTKE